MAGTVLWTGEGLGLAIGTQVLLDDAKISIHAEERVALVGRNGTGKSTFMRIVAGTETPSTGEITLNLHLIKAEPKYIDYVIVHELTHLLYRGHGKRFYSMLLRVMPDARERKKELNKGVVVDG